MAKVKTDYEFNLLDNMSRGLGRIQQGVTGLGASVVKVNAAAELTGRAFGLISNAVSAINETVTASAELELSLSRVAELAGASAEEQKALYDAVQTAGDRFLTTSAEAQETLRLLAEDGFRGQEAISALNTVLGFAQANAQKGAEAAANLGAILDQFGAPAETIGALADALSATAREAKTATTSLQAGLEAIGTQAEQANLTVDQTVALLGVLATKGIEGGRAGKALGTALSELANPASTAGRALADLGVSGDDFLAVLDRLSNDSAAAEKVLSALGTRPRAAIQALLDQGGAALQQFQQVVRDSAGATEKAAKVIEDEYIFQLNRVIEVIARIRNQAIGPILDPLAEGAEKIADKLGELADTGAFEELGAKVAEFVERASADVLRFIESFDTDVAAAQVEELIGKLEKLAEGAAVIIDVGAAVADGVLAIGTAAGESAAKLQIWIERQDAFKAAAALGATAARQFADDVEETGQQSQRTGGQLDNLRRNVAQAVEEFFRITGAARDAAVSVEDIEQASGPAVRSIAQIKRELREAAQAGDDYNTARLTQELARAEQAFESSAGAAAQATEAYKKAEAALRDAIAGGDPAEIEKTRRAFLEQKKLAEENEKTFQRLTKSQQESNEAAAAGAARVAQAQRDTGDAAQQAAEQTQQAAGQSESAVQQLAARINALRAEFAAFGPGAADAFEQRLERLNFGFRGLGTSMINYVTQLENAAGRVRIAIGVQEDAVKNLEGGLSAAILGVSQFGQSAAVTLQRLEQLKNSTFDTNGQFKLLSQQRLDKLRAEIDRTTSAVQAQAQALAELRQLAAAGDDRRSEELRFQQELARIQALEAQTGDRQLAAEARAAAEREHRRRLQEIRERAAAERERYADADRLDAENVARARERRAEPGGAEQPAASGARSTSRSDQPAQQQVFNINIDTAVGVDESEFKRGLVEEVFRQAERRASVGF